MAATSKTELLKVTEADFAKLMKTLETAGEKSALAKDEDDTSIKDIVGHRAHWIELFLGWYADGIAGKKVHMPAKGYKWNQLKEYNAELRKKQHALSWEDCFLLLQRNHKELVNFIEARSDDELYGGQMAGATTKWTAGRFAEAAGPSHYRSALKYTRARLKALS